MLLILCRSHNMHPERQPIVTSRISVHTRTSIGIPFSVAIVISICHYIGRSCHDRWLGLTQMYPKPSCARDRSALSSVSIEQRGSVWYEPGRDEQNAMNISQMYLHGV
jgi:hypothetical protein